MEYVYRDGEGQGSMGRAYRHLCRSIENITDVSQLRNHSQKDVRGTVALLRMRVLTGPGYSVCKGHPGPGTKTPFGRDAAHVGNGVEASAFYAEVRSRMMNYQSIHHMRHQLL